MKYISIIRVMNKSFLNSRSAPKRDVYVINDAQSTLENMVLDQKITSLMVQVFHYYLI